MATRGGLTSDYLSEVCRGLKHFIGVFASDELVPNLKKFTTSQKFSLICNLSPRKDRGTHFITIVRHERNLYYLDSLGHDCHQPNIIDFLRKIKLPVFYMTTQIQDYSSLFCGFYCIMFCHMYEEHGSNFMTKVQFYSAELKKNDELCIQYITDCVNLKNVKMN